MIRLCRAGTNRLVICIAGRAYKLARMTRLARGRRCNRFEERVYATCTADRRAFLCPVIGLHLGGLLLIMREAVPMSEEQMAGHKRRDDLPDWDYEPGEASSPLEYKASDWGYIDGKPVAVDYSVQAIFA